MGNEVPQQSNGFVRVARKVYNPIGFQKGYNFTLCMSFTNMTKTKTLTQDLQGSSLPEPCSDLHSPVFNTFPLPAIFTTEQYKENGTG